MSWIIQKRSDVIQNKSMYLVRDFKDQGETIGFQYTHSIEDAKRFEREDARKFISDNKLMGCSVLPV